MALSEDFALTPWLSTHSANALSRRTLTLVSAWRGVALLAAAGVSLGVAETVAFDGGPARLGFNILSVTFGVLLLPALFLELSRAMGREGADWREWASAAGWALAPLLLATALALLSRGLGSRGVIFYEFGKIVLFVTVAKRLFLLVRELNGWPGWAASLLLLAPAILGALSMIFFVMTMFAAVLLLAAGLAS